MIMRDVCRGCQNFHRECTCPPKKFSDEEVVKQWTELIGPKNKPKGMFFDFDDKCKELSTHDKRQVLEFIELLKERAKTKKR